MILKYLIKSEMVEKEIYLMFNEREYIANKSEILKLKIELINVQKRVQKLTEIRQRKKKLKTYIENNFKILCSKLEMFTKSLPIEIQKKPKQKKENKIKEDFKIGQRDDLAEDLLKIQEQLKSLGV